jgi:putative transposase
MVNISFLEDGQAVAHSFASFANEWGIPAAGVPFRVCSSITDPISCPLKLCFVPTRLKRYYNLKHLHFITCSCFHRLPLLASPRRRDLFLRVLEQARRRYRFVVVGYVVMPEHIHLLISEPEIGDPSVVMKVAKQRFARRLRSGRSSPAQSRLWPEGDESKVWQRRFYDFNIWTERKQIEKLRYIHRNPVMRGLVSEPDGIRRRRSAAGLKLPPRRRPIRITSSRVSWLASSHTDAL